MAKAQSRCRCYYTASLNICWKSNEQQEVYNLQSVCVHVKQSVQTSLVPKFDPS